MQRKLNEVFIDPESGKRLKCVETEDGVFPCDVLCACSHLHCINGCLYAHRDDRKSVHFVETDEPLTE